MLRFWQIIGTLSLTILTVAHAAGASDLETRSPFVPAGYGNQASTTTNPASALNHLVFTAVTTLGGQQLFGVTDKKSNESFWVQMNGTADGFSVVGFDASTSTITVKGSDGDSRSIPLQKSKIIPLAVAKPSTSGKQANNPPPDDSKLTEKQKETEARLMVSDLLEIGMKERARYREEMRRRREQARSSR